MDEFLCFEEKSPLHIDNKNPHPQYNRYVDPKNFKKFRIEHGNVVWGKNWDLVFPLEQLYSGTLV